MRAGLCLFFLLGGCSVEESPAAAPTRQRCDCLEGQVCSNGFCGWLLDTGVTTVDAGNALDAGLAPDAFDASLEVDAGWAFDAGLEVDAGWPFDVGVEVDAGLAVDARTSLPDVGGQDAEEADRGTIDADSPADVGVRLDASPSDSGMHPDAARSDSGSQTIDAGTSDAGQRPDAGGASLVYDLAGFVLSNSEAAQQRFEIPAGTQLRAGEVLLLVRDADRAGFERDLGHPLPANVRYLSTRAAAQGAPIINGGERWRLNAPDGRAVDGPTIAGAAGRAYLRNASPAGQASSWSEVADNARSPGASAVLGPGLWISGWADASGSGRFVFEYVQLSAQ